MTKKFDDNARELYNQSNLLFSEFNYNNEKVKTMKIKPINAESARKYIATYHYSKTLPDSTKYIYAGFLGDSIAGIICYGMGASKNQYTALIPNIKEGQYLELTRLWSHDNMPHNTESKIISESLKSLPKQYKLIISFADPSKGHLGIIYQATNWYYCGMSNKGKSLITNDGIVKHTRLLGIYKKRHPELKNKTNSEIMDIYNWKYIESYGKHRYVMLRGSKKEKKNLFNNIKNKILPYPKNKKAPNDIAR